MTNNVLGRRRAFFGLALVAALAGGCGGPPRAVVKGTVTLDGQPLHEGTVEFFPVDGKGQTAATTLKDGRYEVECSVSRMKVVVNSNVVVGQRKAYNTPDSPMLDLTKNVIPARYNTASELTADLAAGPNEKNFDLKSDAKK